MKQIKKTAVLIPIFLLIILSMIIIPVHARSESSSLNAPMQNAEMTADNTEDGFVEEEIYIGPIITTEDGFRIRLNADGQSYAIIGYAASARNIVIPLDYKGIKITRIANSAFMNKRSIEHVLLNEQIEHIGEGAFDGCDNLVFESDGVGGRYLGIESNSFYYFYKPENFAVAEFSVHENTCIVAAYAFVECRQIEKIVIPSGVRTVGYKAMGNSAVLSSVTLPFVGENGKGEKNSHLGYVFGARTIGGNVSFTPKSLREVNISGGEKIAKNSFYGMDMIENLTLPYLGESAEDTEHGYIGYIYGSDSYNGNVNIPASIKNITVNGGYVGNYVFYDCAKIENVQLKNVVYTGGDFYGYSGCDNIKTAVIPHGVTNIRDSAFKYCSSLESIEISNSVTSIGDYAFSECRSLESVVIGNSVESIGNRAFSYCSSLVSIEISNSVTSIGNRAFYYCSSLVSIEIPNSVTSIGNSAFYYCNNLYYVKNNSELVFTIGSSDYGYVAYYAKAIEDKNGNITFKDSNNIVIDDFLFTKSENGKYQLIAYVGNEKTVTLPQDILGQPYTIYQMKGVKNVIIPEGITSIGNNAFSYCRSLVSIEIPNSVTSIGDWAFRDCRSLESITVASGNTKYHSSGNCLIETARKTLIVGCKNSVIPIDGSVTGIGDYAFSNCSSLESVRLKNGQSTKTLEAAIQ